MSIDYLHNPSWTRVGDDERLITRNWLFRLWSRKYRSSKSGKQHDFFVAELADCVQVVAVTPDQRVLLVRQFRAGSGKDSLEIPGGLVEPGEEPTAAGARELIEETGFAGDPPRIIGSFWANPSLLTSRITTIVITNAIRVRDPKPDATEELEITLAPVDQIYAMIKRGEIDHALVVASLLTWLLDERAVAG